MKISDSLETDFLNTDVESVKKRFEKHFGNSRSTNIVTTPASLILLGDHTHYNDGLLLSVALNKYSVVMLRKRKDDKIVIVDDNSGDVNEFAIKEKPVSNNINDKFIIELFYQINEIININKGFECVFNNPIPECIGLGRIVSIQVSFALALKKAFRINLNTEEILSIIKDNELLLLGKIANYAHIYTVKFQKDNKLFFIDLRTMEHKTVPIKKDEFDLVIFDTGERVIEPQKICDERIEECQIGVEGLRLYIWGIKNLRDVQLDFLFKHFHMLPKRIFNRILYNVKERIRVENSLKALKNNSYEGLGKFITDSHWNMSHDYELSCKKCDFLVTAASNNNCALGSKMISCTTFRSTFNIVKKGCTQDYINSISGLYENEFNEKLMSYSFHLSGKG